MFTLIFTQKRLSSQTEVQLLHMYSLGTGTVWLLTGVLRNFSVYSWLMNTHLLLRKDETTHLSPTTCTLIIVESIILQTRSITRLHCKEQPGLDFPITRLSVLN